jgi:archaellum component FlaC
MEDALKRLDKLTQEEARMAVAQNLKATHTVDERVKGVANTVVAIDNRVADVDDRVACVVDQVARVDDNVKGINARVAIVDDSVKMVDDKIDEVIHGAQIIFSQTSEIF